MIYSEPLRSIKDIPKKSTSFMKIDNERNCTDIICTLVAVSFAIFMLVWAVLFMKVGKLFSYTENYYKSNFPTDSSHVPCAYAENQKFPMVYFPDINNIALVYFS